MPPDGPCAELQAQLDQATERIRLLDEALTAERLAAAKAAEKAMGVCDVALCSLEKALGNVDRLKARLAEIARLATEE